VIRALDADRAVRYSGGVSVTGGGFIRNGAEQFLAFSFFDILDGIRIAHHR
jgi:hypothetical protein